MEYTNQKTDDELKKRTRAALELQMDVETATKVIADWSVCARLFETYYAKIIIYLYKGI